MIENYINYLNFLDEKLTKFFTRQKPYICCKKGCGRCCQNAQFPYSQIEINYLKIGIWKLDLKTKKIIANNIKKVISQKEKFDGDNFTYNCPFLINNECSVYEYRGIICRSFGLMNIGSNGRIKVPFCCFQGFNYSNVMDDDGNKISAEKFKKLGVEEEPVAFNTSYEFLTDPDFEQGFHFKFGDKKPLIDWFVDSEEKKYEHTHPNIQIS